MSRSVRLLLIRHAETPSNVTRLLDTGVPGPGLTDLGREQAALLPQEFDHGRPDVLFVSSMQRTQHTAAPLATRFGLEPVIRPGLREISAGHLELRGDDEAVEVYHGFLGATAGGRDAELAAGETTADVLTRFDAVVAEMVATGGDLLVAFSHGAVIRAWTGRRAVNLDEDFILAHPLRNTGQVLLEGHPDSHWVARSWDATVLDDTPVPTGVSGPGGEATEEPSRQS